MKEQKNKNTSFTKVIRTAKKQTKNIARYTNNYCLADFQGAPEVSSSKVSERYTRLV